MAQASHEFRGSVDFNQYELRNATFQNLITPPVGPKQGQIYFNSALDWKSPFYWDSTEWIPFGLKPIHKKYGSEALLLAGQSRQISGYIYHRTDLDIYYEYLGTTLGSMTDYNPIGGSGFTGGGGGGYVHPTYTPVSQTLNGATVLASFASDGIGSVTGFTTRTLTLANLGYTGATDANNYVHPNHSGDVFSVSDGITTIQPQAVTYAKIQNVTGDRMLGRISTTGSVQELTATQVRSFLNIADGANNYVHPSKAWVDKSNLNGATVISNLIIDSLGHPTDWVTRNLTPADIGAQPSGSYVLTTRTLTINGVSQDLSIDRTWVIGTSSYQRDVFAYAASNSFNLTRATPVAVQVFLNGQKLEFTSDWSISGSIVTLLPTLEAGDEISIEYFYSTPDVVSSNLNGTGTAGFLTKWNGAAELGVSLIQDNGTLVTLPAATDIAAVAATIDTDKFVVLEANRFKFRTGAQILSDIGAQAAGSYGLSNADITAVSFTTALLTLTRAAGNLTASVPTFNQNTTGSAATLTTPRTLTIGSTGKAFNGSANVAWSLAEIGAAAILHSHVIGDITGLQAALDAKVPISRILTINGIAQDLSLDRSWTIPSGGGFDDVYDNGTSGSGTKNFDWTNGLTQKISLTGNSTFTFTNPSSGDRYELLLIQDATGGRLITWPEINWEGKVFPALSIPGNFKDKVELTYTGTEYWGKFHKNFGVPSNTAIITDNLVLWWDAGNPASYPGTGTTIEDLTSSNFDGTLNGLVYNSSSGGRFISVESENDWINSTGSDSGNGVVGTSDFTIEVWVQLNNVNQQAWLFGNRNNSAGPQFSMIAGTPTDGGSITGSKKLGISMVSTNTGTVRVYSTVNDIVDGGWKHIVVTKVGLTFKLYVNAVDQSLDIQSSVGSSDDVTNTSTWRMGDNGAGNGSFAFDGSAAINRLYKGKALTLSEVQNNFDTEKNRFGL